MWLQMAVTGLFCLAWAAWDATHSGASNGNYSLQAWRDPIRLAALLWPAIGPWGLGTYLQASSLWLVFHSSVSQAACGQPLGLEATALLFDGS